MKPEPAHAGMSGNDYKLFHVLDLTPLSVRQLLFSLSHMQPKHALSQRDGLSDIMKCADLALAVAQATEAAATQATEAAAAAVKVTSGDRQHDGLVTLTLSQEHTRWVQFQDNAGRTAGSIEMNETGGAYLNSTAGDFAEWHPRLPTERPLEEGDVVALCEPPPGAKYDRSYITLTTRGASQLGVISRRAIMTGSFPGVDAQTEFDTVAYCGRVPVKVIGGAQVGDYLVPSGREDGTAVGKSGPSAVKIAQVERAVDCPDSSCTTQKGSYKLSRPALGTNLDLEMMSVQGSTHTYQQQQQQQQQHQHQHQHQQHQHQWHHVVADVFAPNCTVTPTTWQERLNKGAMVPLSTMACLCVVAGLVWFTKGSPLACNPVELNHGTVQGNCDGKPGSSCRYSGCDDGYRMRAQTVDDGGDCAEPSVQAVRPPGGAISLVDLPANRTWVRQFPPCSTCFGTDGLMCEPNGRTFPLPLPEYWAGTYAAVGFSSDLAEYLYHCSSAIDDLTTCEESGGTLCYGEYIPASQAGISGFLVWLIHIHACCCTGLYGGVRPCEACASAGPAGAGYQPDGLACEITDREIWWNGWNGESKPSRRVDHRKCVSGDAVFGVFSFPEPHCKKMSWGAGGNPALMPDDNDYMYGLCVPLDQQSRTRMNASSMTSADVDIRRIPRFQPTAANGTRPPTVDSQAWPQNASGGLVRTCHADGQWKSSKEMADYDGHTMRCARQYCPPETLGLLRLGACELCDGKEPLVHFPK